MKKIHEKILVAIKASKVKDGYEYDAFMVTKWYNNHFKTDLSVQMIAQHLNNCVLPRRRLTKNQQWKWFKATGKWARYLYQNRQIGWTAYPESRRVLREREANTNKHLARMAEYNEME